MTNHQSNILLTVRQLLRLILGVIVSAACILAIPTSISASGSTNPYDLLIVVNKSVETDHLTIYQVRDYFLKKRSGWPEGSKAIPVNAKDKTLREAFRQRVLLMSTVEEQRYWQNQLVRSAKKAPPEFSNTLKAVFKLRGSLGYVFRKDYLKNVVNVVLEIPAE